MPEIRGMYEMAIPDVFAASELAQDSLDFIEGAKDSKDFHCPHHSQKESDGDE